MSFRRTIFRRIVGLLTALIVAICLMMSLLTTVQHCRREKEDAALTARFLAENATNLVLWDDRIAMKGLLEGILSTDSGIGYACVERNGKPYVQATRSGQIEVPPSPGPLPASVARVSDVRTREGQCFWDMSVPMGRAAAVARLGLSQSKVYHEALVKVLRIACVGVVMVLLGSLLAALFARRITCEVERLNISLRQHKDHLEQQVAERTGELTLLNHALEQDIEQRKRVETELVAAREMAESASRAKSEFLANMSHEIRTPMTAILGFANVLRENLANSEDVEAVQIIRRNGEHLLEIINGILDVSRIEAGRFRTDAVDCSPSEIVSEVIALMRARANAKGLQLATKYAGPIPQTIQSDPVRIRQILINLIENAIKFTELGTVQLVVHLAEDAMPPQLQFDVIDTGIGIRAEHIQHLFQPFSQVDSSSRRQYGGTGLGLTISKRLANLLGGDVSVRSVLGQGSTFTATISTGPLAALTTLETMEESPLPGPGAAARSRSIPSLLDTRVLLVEDGPDNQRLLALILKKAGAQVTIAENGQIACDYALGSAGGCSKPGDEPTAPFDVILMDIQMPVMDGYEATRKLRLAGYAGPIVALTAHAMDSDREKCLAAGCDDYIAKPVCREDLLKAVARHTRPKVLSS